MTKQWINLIESQIKSF